MKNNNKNPLEFSVFQLESIQPFSLIRSMAIDTVLLGRNEPISIRGQLARRKLYVWANHSQNQFGCCFPTN